ncbi:MAG: 2-amino-4-hydroxy-6-hydroxymethyldihydropteridine diphosphokinase [Flavobacteriales bacterium]
MGGTRDLVLLLGGDMGDQERLFTEAERSLAERLRVADLRPSRDHWTEPWGFAHPALFLNRALWCTTTLPAHEVLDHVLAVERELGRTREPAAGYGPRIIDIDILFVGEEVHDTPALQVPHPLLHQRAFALAPAADLVPSFQHPVLQRTVLQLLNDLRPA